MSWPKRFAASLGGLILSQQLFSQLIVWLDGAVIMVPPWSAIVWARTGQLAGNELAAGFILSLVGVLAPIVIMEYLAGTHIQAGPFGSTARASMVELRSAGLLAGSGIALGAYRGHHLSFDDDGHALIAGAAGSGKTTGTMMCTILQWPGSMLIYDPKRELFEQTSSYRARLGPVYRLDLGDATGHRFNPLSEIGFGEGRVAAADALSSALVAAVETDTNRFWTESASSVITGLILHAMAEGSATMGHVRMLVADLASRQIDQSRDSIATQRLQAFCAYEERLRTNILGTIDAAMRALDDPPSKRLLSQSDFSPVDLVAREYPTTVYIQSPAADSVRLAPIARILLTALLRPLWLHEGHVDGARKRHVLLAALDEMAQLRLPIIPDLYALGRGYGIRCLGAVQDLAQLRRAYGHDHAILANASALIAMGTIDGESLDFLSRTAGRSREYRMSHSMDRMGFRRGYSANEHVEHTIASREIREMKNRQLVLLRGVRPFIAEQRRAWRDKPWKDRLGVDLTAPPQRHQPHKRMTAREIIHD